MPDPVELLAEWVRVPSVNPSFANVPVDYAGEARLATAAAAWLKKHGFAVELPEVLPGRPNVLARAPGRGQPILLTAHLDTVPVDGMTIGPFGGSLHQGAVWGRGAADTKGSLVAMLVAAAESVAENGEAGPALIILLTCDEEHGFAGVRHFVANAKMPLRGAVVGEPTGNQLVTAHKGVWRAEVTTRGKAAHASMPEQGVNAIYRMTPVLERLEGLARELQLRPPHPTLGAASLSIGTIRGGDAVNQVPNSCTIELDRRLLPEEDNASVAAEVAAALADLPELEVRSPTFSIPCLAMAEGDSWGRFVAEALEQPRGGTVPYGTDGAVLSQAGISCVVCGPGAPGAAHRADEHLSVSELKAAVRLYKTILQAAIV